MLRSNGMPGCTGEILFMWQMRHLHRAQRVDSRESRRQPDHDCARHGLHRVESQFSRDQLYIAMRFLCADAAEVIGCGRSTSVRSELQDRPVARELQKAFDASQRAQFALGQVVFAVPAFITTAKSVTIGRRALKDIAHQETEAVRGGTDLHKRNSLATPIYQTSTFEVADHGPAGAATTPNCSTPGTATTPTVPSRNDAGTWKAPTEGLLYSLHGCRRSRLRSSRW